jgi:hypothetical protein
VPGDVGVGFVDLKGAHDAKQAEPNWRESSLQGVAEETHSGAAAPTNDVRLPGGEIERSGHMVIKPSLFGWQTGAEQHG